MKLREDNVHKGVYLWSVSFQGVGISGTRSLPGGGGGYVGGDYFQGVGMYKG